MAMPAPLPTPAPAPAPSMPTRGARPLGVTILAVLDAIIAVVLLLGGLAAMFLGALASSFSGLPFGALIGGFVGIVLVFFAIAFGILAYGLWHGEGWGWTLGVILAAIGLVLSLPGALLIIGIVPLLLNAFLLWYFTQDGVKRWFGKA